MRLPASFPRLPTCLPACPPACLKEAAKGGLPNPFKLGPTFIATQAGPCLDLVENATLMQVRW
jgi:hypothetical protein